MAQSSAPCPNCGKPLAWIAQYGQWYCYADQQYFPPAKLVQPALSEPYPAPARANGLTGTKLFLIIVAAILAVVLIIGFALAALFAATVGLGTDSSQLTLDILSASWRPEDTYGFSPDPGMRFLWLVVNVHNAGDEPVAISALYFTAEGTEGSSYDSRQLRGPDSIASGGSGNVKLVFEVPDSWVPRTLHYDLLFGPEAATPIPTPVVASYSGNLAVDSWYPATEFQGRTPTGSYWLIAKVTFQNTGNIEIALGRFDWKIADVDGFFIAFPEEQFYTSREAWPGRNVSLSLVFDLYSFSEPAKVILTLPDESKVSGLLTSQGGEVRSIGINLGSAGNNYTLLFTSVPQGIAKAGTFVLIRSPTGAITCQRTAFPSLNGAATGCTAVWYSPVTSGVNIEVQDALLVSKMTYLAGSVIEISDANGILARATLS